MIKFKTMKVLTVEDVEKLTGISWIWFKFAENAENGSYQILPVEDWYIDDLEDEINYIVNAIEEATEYKLHRMQLLKNELRLVNLLRDEYNIHCEEEEVLIYVEW